ncbi:hypothetical protein C8D03_1312 [Bosea sp. 124]|nr:hypothetical protein C8D03_1312 [Bosea sp. 124]
MTNLLDNIAEFRAFVWDHSLDAFQAQFDERRFLNDHETSSLVKIARASMSEPEKFGIILKSSIYDDAAILSLVLQICGLTRNKILQDLKASADLNKNGIQIPGKYSALPNSRAWPAASSYIASRMRKVFHSFADQSDDALGSAIESLNQATWPGYIRQERAKRSGHEAEYRLATLMFNCNIPFEPKMKAENPLCADAQISGVSFDLVVPSVLKPILVFKSTVHTANIGQYGESKDDLEIKHARAMIESKYSSQRPILMAFIDGVGFYSNKSGLEGVLTGSDEFCQFRTIWKSAAIALTQLRRNFRIYLSEQDMISFEPFLKRRGCIDSVVIKTTADLDGSEIEAGDALIKIF